MKNLPNILTLFRIFVIPILIASFFLGGKTAHWVATSLFVLASLTDFFDGYLARLYKVESRLGTMLDPIADKLLVSTVIIMLVHFGGGDLFITIPGIIILFRELFVSGLREFLAGIQVSMPVSNLSKWKTGLQMGALSLLILGEKGTGLYITEIFGKIGLVLAAILTLVTGFAYLKKSAKHL
jgi:CDP-diacylglycerol--glycerol-3-phosphate 3-phosphatidyltransferase